MKTLILISSLVLILNCSQSKVANIQLVDEDLFSAVIIGGDDSLTYFTPIGNSLDTSNFFKKDDVIYIQHPGSKAFFLGVTSSVTCFGMSSYLYYKYINNNYDGFGSGIQAGAYVSMMVFYTTVGILSAITIPNNFKRWQNSKKRMFIPLNNESQNHSLKFLYFPPSKSLLLTYVYPF